MYLFLSTVLSFVASHFSFEAAVGMNGAVWIRSKDSMESIIIRNAILNSEFLDDIQTEAMIDAVVKNARKLKAKSSE